MRGIRRRNVAVLAGAALAGTAGVAGADPLSAPAAQVPSRLEGTAWALRFLPGPDGRLQPVEWGTEVTALFENGRLSGNAGCNTYSGFYLLPQADALTISGLSSVRNVCATGRVFAQENTFLDSLQQVGRFSDAPDHLVLRDRLTRPLLVFGLRAAEPLEGTEWLAEGYANDFGAIVPVPAGAEVTATFTGGAVSGNAGCNLYAGTYSLNGALITIQAGASALRTCADPPGVMEGEAGFLNALPQARTYLISGDRLFLLDELARRVATFIARAAQTA